MKIVAISIVRRDPAGAHIVAAEYDLSSFSFFQRGMGQEFLAFFSKTIAERTERGIRQSVEEDANIAHAFTSLAGLACVIICDREYPSRVAFALINRLLDDFTATFSRDTWLATSSKLDYPMLREMLVKYQNPHEADSIMRVQRELDDTKTVLRLTMQSLLERGERLDDLVGRSDELSRQSKMFFKSAKKTNSCCVIQ